MAAFAALFAQQRRQSDSEKSTTPNLRHGICLQQCNFLLGMRLQHRKCGLRAREGPEHQIL
jgi:hypothetical protein